MLPHHYFQVICCPRCRADLQQIIEQELICNNCQSTYPVIDGIPLLLYGPEDEVSQVIKGTYESRWKRNQAGILIGKITSEDISDLGQQYIKTNENRFVSLFNRNSPSVFFLDAGSGAQPRLSFGKDYSYHICLDFSIDGLKEGRKLLEERAICVCASLLNIPIKDSVCGGIVCSHVLYHIDSALQVTAIGQLSRVLRPEGTMLLFYGNPNSFENSLIKWLNRKQARLQTNMNCLKGTQYYYYAHSISHMLSLLRSEFGEPNVAVKPLRMFSKRITRRLFRNRLLGRIIFGVISAGEYVLKGKPEVSTYIAYVVEK